MSSAKRPAGRVCRVDSAAMLPASARWQRGRASEFIDLFSTLRAGDPVVLACRVSGCQQERGGNLDDEENFLRQIAKQVGLQIVGVCRHTGSGFDPFWLHKAATIAKA